jgi:hypothetical protein
MIPEDSMSDIPDYSIDDVKNKFPIINDETTFREYIVHAKKNNHIMQIYKYLVNKSLINPTLKANVTLKTEGEPFNVFARYADNKMKNFVDQTIIEKYSDEWMICHNRTDNDKNWNDVTNKNVSMCGHDENGPGHVFITTKDLNWKNFNVATLVLYKKVDFLLKLKEVAKEYAKQRGWNKAGFYFHCFPHNSVQSLHLHVVNEDEKYIGHMFNELHYKNLPLDVAIKVAQSL